MGKTYRKTKDGGLVSDGGRHIPKTRYRAGSRTKQRNLGALGVRRSEPDLRKFGQAALDACEFQQELTVAVKDGSANLANTSAKAIASNDAGGRDA